MKFGIHPRFLTGFEGGVRFGLRIEPPEGIAQRGALLSVQGFGDEANLSRRAIMAQAMAAAAQGWATLVVDLYGCADSPGESEDASLDLWRRDLDRALDILRASANGPLVLWGIRFGCLLAVDLVRRARDPLAGLILWQPPEQGKAALDGWMKLTRPGAIGRTEKPAAVLPNDGGSASQVRSSDDAIIDLAGYRFPRTMIDELLALDMSISSERPAPEAACPPIMLLGMQRIPSGTSAVARTLGKLSAHYQAAGLSCQQALVQADPFWSSMEPGSIDAAVLATGDFLRIIHA